MDRIDIPKWNFEGGTLQERDVKVATGALDFPSIAAAGAATLTITLAGVEVGDAVTVTCADAAGPHADVNYTAWVSAADTVTLRARNLLTATAVDPVSANFVALVVKK